MVIIGVIIIAAGLAAFAWLWLTLAAYALPVIIGIYVGHGLLANGFGMPCAIATACLSACLTLAAGRLAAIARTPAWIAPVTLVAFMLPAGIAAYDLMQGVLRGLHLSDPAWSLLCGLASGVVALSVPSRLRPAAT